MLTVTIEEERGIGLRMCEMTSDILLVIVEGPVCAKLFSVFG